MVVIGKSSVVVRWVREWHNRNVIKRIYGNSRASRSNIHSNKQTHTNTGTKLEANGVVVHDYLKSQRVTRTMLFPVPDEALRIALKTETLTFQWIPEHPRKVTFIDLPLPVAEFWVLNEKRVPRSNL